MKLAFRNKYSRGYREQEVPIMINMWTIEAIGKEFGVEFYQVSEVIKDNNYEFMVQLLYKGYLTACHDRFDRHILRTKKPEYTPMQAIIWYENLNVTSRDELLNMLQQFMSGISKTTVKKKEEKVKQPSQS